MSAISGLNHTARTLAVYASQVESPRAHARLASVCWPDFDGRDCPAAPLRKVSSDRYVMVAVLLSQAFLTQGACAPPPPLVTFETLPSEVDATWLRSHLHLFQWNERREALTFESGMGVERIDEVPEASSSSHR